MSKLDLASITHPYAAGRTKATSDPPEIIIHCSAEPPGRYTNAETIDRWHRDKGWVAIGYNYVITVAGTIEGGRPLGVSAAHTTGHNDSVGICMIGGLDDDWQPSDKHYTDAQWSALERLVTALHARYPNARIAGHNEFAPKACPCFSVTEWWARMQLGTKPEEPTEAALPASLTINGVTYTRAQ